ncbi:Maf family protein, partial [Alistipes ihumii]
MLLAEKLKAYRLILASASPRRRQLLVGCGLPFVQAEPYDVSETYPAGMPAGEVPVYLARLKSDAYPLPLASFDILVTADTVVAVDDRILGKPADRGV